MRKEQKMWNRNNMVKIWTQMYCIFLFLIFPLYYQQSYINILEAKTHFFIISSVIYLVGCILIMLPPIFLKRIKKEKIELSEIMKKKISLVDSFCILFFVTILISTALSDDTKDVIFGTNGRLFGAIILLLCIGLYYCFSHFSNLDAFFLWCCLMGIGLVCIFAILNRFGIDCLGMYEAIDVVQRKDYLSTIGQINILSGYLCGFLALFSGLFLYSNRLLSKILYGIITVLIFIAGICSNSDSFFLAILVTFLFYFTIFLSDIKKISDFFLLAAFISGAMLIMQIISIEISLTVWRELQNKFINNIPWMVLIILFVIMYFVSKKYSLVLVKRVWIVFLGISILSIIIYIIIANSVLFPSDVIIAKKWILFL